MLYSLLIIAFSPDTHCQATDEDSLSDIDLLKSAYILKIASFIYWPEEALGEKATPLICIIGHDTFHAAYTLLNNQSKYLYRDQADIVEADASSILALPCDIAFVSAAEMTSTLRHTLGSAPKHMITISDKRGFAKDIGIIELSERSNRIRMLINMSNLNGLTVKLSSQLLEVAELL
ncbi:MAG: YfiR family protein [Candidatus Thiodiazotropha endolucinida]